MKLLIFSVIIFLFLISVVYAVEFSLLATVKINPIYDLTLDIEVITKNVLAGDNLTVFIKLNKNDLTEIKEEIIVDLNYDILKPNKKVLDSDYAGEIKVKDYNETTIQISIPTDTRPSRYILNVTANHSQAISSSDSDVFWIKKRRLRFSTFNFFEYFGMILTFFL